MNQNKKVVQTYTCDQCGRQRIARFKEAPTPASYGVCPRCKEGVMFSVIITDVLKNGEDVYKKHNIKDPESFYKNVKALKASTKLKTNLLKKKKGKNARKKQGLL